MSCSQRNRPAVEKMQGVVLFLLSYPIWVRAVPANLDCSRKIVVGESVMASHFKMDVMNSSASIQVRGVPCGGVLYTSTNYVVDVKGLVSTSSMWLGEVTDKGLNPFPGAAFGNQMLYNGKLVSNIAMRGNLTLWNTVASSAHMILTNFSRKCPNRFINSVNATLQFNAPGEAQLRLAWGVSTSFQAVSMGVNVVDHCSYIVKPLISCMFGAATTTTSVGGNGYCLSGNLKCGILDCTGANPLMITSKDRVCALQSAFCVGVPPGVTIKAYWGSKEMCPRGTLPDVFPDLSGYLTSMTCCDTNDCNSPGQPAPQPRCMSASARFSQGPCKDNVLSFNTCSLGWNDTKKTAAMIEMEGNMAPLNLQDICTGSMRDLCTQLGGTVSSEFSCDKSFSCGLGAPNGIPRPDGSKPAYPTVWSQCTSDAHCPVETLSIDMPPPVSCCSEIRNFFNSQCSNLDQAKLSMFLVGRCIESGCVMMANQPQPKCLGVNVAPTMGYCAGRSVGFNVCAQSQATANELANMVTMDANDMDDGVVSTCEWATAGACASWTGGMAKSGQCNQDTICTLASTTGIFGSMAMASGASPPLGFSPPPAALYNQCRLDSDCDGFTMDAYRNPGRACCAESNAWASATCANINAGMWAAVTSMTCTANNCISQMSQTGTGTGTCPQPMERCCTRLVASSASKGLRLDLKNNVMVTSIRMWWTGENELFQNYSQLVDFKVSVGTADSLTGCELMYVEEGDGMARRELKNRRVYEEGQTPSPIDGVMYATGGEVEAGDYSLVLVCGSSGNIVSLSFPNLQPTDMPGKLAIRTCTANPADFMAVLAGQPPKVTLQGPSAENRRRR